jgi:hypothetical protein
MPNFQTFEYRLGLRIEEEDRGGGIRAERVYLIPQNQAKSRAALNQLLINEVSHPIASCSARRALE